MRRSWLFALLVFGLADAVVAEPLDEDRVVSKATNLDATLGYILIHGTGRQGGTFIRIPDAEDIASYRKTREDGWAEELKRYQSKLSRWKKEVAIAEKTKQRIPDKPIEPIESKFSIGPIEQRTSIHFGPDYVYSKDKTTDQYSYFMSVKPGKYIWYGPVIFDPKQGIVGLCYCMGSLSFEVKPGIVTNLGNFLTAAPLAEQQRTAPLLDIRHNGGLTGFKIEPPKASSKISFAVPGSIANWPMEQAQFSASGKLNNFYGVMISRLPPVTGILAYNLDQVIDAKTGATVPNAF